MGTAAATIVLEAIDAHTQSDANATVESSPSAPLTAASFPS